MMRPFLPSFKSFLTVMILTFVGLPAAMAQSTIAYWAQNSNNLDGGGFGYTPASFPQKADIGEATLTIGNFVNTTDATTGAYTTIKSFGGSTEGALAEYASGGSFSPEGGTSTGNNGMYFDLNLDLTGYSDISLSWAQRGTASGFTSRKVSYSVDGGENFTDFATDSGALSSTWTVKTFDFSEVTGMNDNDSVVVRVTLDGATGDTGNNRFDNILVKGTDPNAGPQTVTIRDLNTYPAPIESASASELQAHPLAGKEVTFTAVVVSNPRSSGLASLNSDGSISRLHVFVTDTSALNAPEGRSGMSLQIVETNLEFVENLVRGGIYTFTGVQTFYFSTAQFDLTAAPVEVGNVNVDLSEYAPLLEPWTISLDELNVKNDDGTFEVNAANYSKYIGAYVKIDSASVIVQETGSRPNWAVDKESRVWVYDTSLRFRNDRNDAYRDGYNFRRSVANGGKGEFVPPTTGSLINLSGFVVLNNDNPGGDNASGKETMNINPMEDGTFWSQDSTRFDDGDDLGGATFSWPNDVKVLKAPPSITAVALTPDTTIFASSDEIVLSADILSSVEGVTVDSATVTYLVTGEESVTAKMSNSGSTYSFTFPAIGNGKVVAWKITSYGSDGLTGNYPFIGSESFIVSDGGINSLALIQTTADGKTGASPLAGSKGLTVNLTGTIVSDSKDGVIILHDAAAPWGGVFLERSDKTTALKRGDVINITKASVVEASNSSSSATFTQLTELTFTVTSSGADVEALIPSVQSETVLASLDNAEFEPYEGMLVRFEDAQFVSEGSFGEFTIATKHPDSAAYPSRGVIFNEDTRSAAIGETSFPGDVNQHIKNGTIFESITGFVVSSFGAPKIIPRGVEDLKGADWSFPRLLFALNGPEEGAQVELNGDLSASWQSTRDYDGDTLSYEWVVYDSEKKELAAVPSADGGKATNVTVPFEAVDALFASLDIEAGVKVDLFWNVRVIDSSEDAFPVAGRYSFSAQAYDTLYRSVSVTLGAGTSTDGLSQLPEAFRLRQNYPNPFNPSTMISFDLPVASKVTLSVYNLLGQRVALLIGNEMRQAGTHSVRFDASTLASGTYMVRMDAGQFTQTRKMLLMK